MKTQKITELNQIEELNSPSYGRLPLPVVIDKITEFMKRESDYQYRIIIGTDSQKHNSRGTDFVTALVVHRVGGGGIYFWKSYNQKRPYALKERIYEEALASLDFANNFILSLKQAPKLLEIGLEIHVDVGENGLTRDMITEVVSMIKGNGYDVKTKPQAFGASSVADRHA